MNRGREAIIRCRLLPDGTLEYEGWGTGAQRCRPEELGRRVVQILHQPDLPPIDTTSAGHDKLVDAYAQVVLPPHLRPLLKPSVHALRDLFGHLRRGSDDGSWARHQDHAQQQQQQPPPDPPHKRAYRRGRRVG